MIWGAFIIVVRPLLYSGLWVFEGGSHKSNMSCHEGGMWGGLACQVPVITLFGASLRGVRARF